MKRLRQYVHEQIEGDVEFAGHLEQARVEVQLAIAIAQLRERRGMSQWDLTRETGIKEPQIASPKRRARKSVSLVGAR